MSFRVKQGFENIIVLPIVIMDKLELWIFHSDQVDQVTTDKNIFFQPGLIKGLENPVEHALAADFCKTLRLILGQVIQPLTASCSD